MLTKTFNLDAINRLTEYIYYMCKYADMLYWLQVWLNKWGQFWKVVESKFIIILTFSSDGMSHSLI